MFQKILDKYHKKNIIQLPHSIWTNPIHFIACGFGLGTSPIVPGTVGTLGGVVLAMMLAPLPLWLYVSITLALIIAGVYLCGEMNRAFGTDDHPAAVWDELATFPLVMIAIPQTWIYLLSGFLLFRFFDILKPWPICWVDEHVHGGIGVMLDDVLAALASWVILLLVSKLHLYLFL